MKRCLISACSFHLLLLVAVLLIVPAATRAAPENVIDWAKGWAQDTTASCGAFTFRNLRDRHGYSLYVRGTEAGTCSFHAEGLTFRYPPNYGSVTAGARTIFSFERYGSDVLVTWVPGY